MRTDVIQAEIEAYLDGELDLERRLAVEGYLSGNPQAAAAVMADLRARTALQLLHGIGTTPSPAIDAAATRLRQRLTAPAAGWRRLPAPARIGGAIAAAMLALAVILPQTGAFARTPAYVSDAAMAYRTALLRANMQSQPESTVLDTGEIMRATRIRIPRLPSGWRVTDAQIFPSDDGPSLMVMIRTAEGKSMSIFAVRASSDAPLSPVAVRQGQTSVAYWRNGDVAYALTGTEAPEALDHAAEGFAAGVSL